MLPTSLPGGRPGGMTAARPTRPRAASLASVGIDATSSGVRPPSPSNGSSAQPSGTHTTYFMGPEGSRPTFLEDFRASSERQSSKKETEQGTESGPGLVDHLILQQHGRIADVGGDEPETRAQAIGEEALAGAD